ncbi:MAG TPA: RNA 2',3'-cyclic phosphodiesterase [Candidatus Paceibacterota bacterium]|nr:RNA 2',3'-cyclic phosphodiesterase [Candidatus Paceibacterota bacterium]
MESALRLFAALTLPEALVDRLVSLQRILDSHWPARSVRWVRREQLHLTLRFYGNVPSEEAPALTEALRVACAGTRPLSLAIAGLGAFPNTRRPRVLWAGVTGDLEPLERLEQRIQSATAAFGDHRDTRSFQPHLTLGRIGGDRERQAAPPPNARWDQIENDLVGSWTATAVHLIRSELDPAGARYTTLGVAPFPGV